MGFSVLSLFFFFFFFFFIYTKVKRGIGLRFISFVVYFWIEKVLFLQSFAFYHIDTFIVHILVEIKWFLILLLLFLLQMVLMIYESMVL
jgi:hypothetical protein